jgi:hypothetical protein
MDTQACLYEIDGIDTELVRLRKKVKVLNLRKKNLQAIVINNLKESGEEQYVHKGKKYIVEEQTRYSRKNDKKRREAALSVLGEEGIHGAEADDLYSKISSSFIGSEKVCYKLKKPT